jgi:hypothetical protein
MSTGRNSIGFEIDSNFKEHIISRLENLVDFSNQLLQSRIENHIDFVQKRTTAKGRLRYTSSYYGFPVMTSQEKEIAFDELTKIKTKGNAIEAEYRNEPTIAFREGKLERKDKPSLSQYI